MASPFYRVVSGLAEEFVRDLKRDLPRATGDLARSVALEVDRLGESCEAVVTIRAPYARYVQRGTRPHFVSGYRLLEWVKARRTYARYRQSPQQAAFALARAIAMEGTLGYNYLSEPLRRFRSHSGSRLRSLAHTELQQWMRG